MLQKMETEDALTQVKSLQTTGFSSNKANIHPFQGLNTVFYENYPIFSCNRVHISTLSTRVVYASHVVRFTVIR